MTVPSRKKAVLFQSRTASREASREAARPLRGAVMQNDQERFFSNANLFFFTGAPQRVFRNCLSPRKKS
jgi:hypothetical protein